MHHFAMQNSVHAYEVSFVKAKLEVHAYEVSFAKAKLEGGKSK